MTEIADIRRANLRRILAERFGGNTAALSRMTERAAPIYHAILSTPPQKGFGEKLARHIEKKLDLEHGWLDTDELLVRDPDLSPSDSLFLLSVRNGLTARAVPAHAMQTILMIIDQSPKK
jgi:hypothetical protein